MPFAPICGHNRTQYDRRGPKASCFCHWTAGSAALFASWGIVCWLCLWLGCSGLLLGWMNSLSTWVGGSPVSLGCGADRLVLPADIVQRPCAQKVQYRPPVFGMFRNRSRRLAGRHIRRVRWGMYPWALFEVIFMSVVICRQRYHGRRYSHAWLQVLEFSGRRARALRREV
ncbi:hypothetical protein V8F44DRAFT_73267 [Aspergillus fumigatus]|jgi:hypothetical protein